MKTLRAVSQDGLGKCWHCDTVFSASWLNLQKHGGACPHCEKDLTPESFGQFQVAGGSFEFLLWIGPEGCWTNVRPTEPFELEVKLGYETEPRLVRVVPRRNKQKAA